METLASVWVHDPCDLSNLGEKSSLWDSQCVYDGSPPAGLKWTDNLSPQLQRNKQLQDTLLQREEELARLQDENNKLREFLNSSFVRNLGQKAKELTSDGRRKLKRNLMTIDDGSLQNSSHQLLTSQPVSKRVCRNLTAEFCSESPETSSSEPNLDLWVLRTLGLKDRDTIDTSSNASEYTLNSLVYDAAVPSEYTVNFSPSVTSTPSSVHSYCQRSTQKTDYRCGPAESQKANCSNPTQSPQNCTTPLVECRNSTATGQCEAPEAVSSTLTAFPSPPLTKQPFTNNQSVEQSEISSIAASSQVQSMEGNPYWSPLRVTPSQDTIQFSPPRERVPFSPLLSSTPVMTQLWTPVLGGSPTSPSAGFQTPAAHQTPRSRIDLAFSMSLSPSSSVKTHSFPQGQAFVRKDNEGRCNFTWVPTQRQ